MHETEQTLQQLKEQLDHLQIPVQINDYIRMGMERGKRRKRQRKAVLRSSIAACFALMALLVSTRFSPVMAAYVSKVPGMETIVKLINHDKGLQLAAENQFIQPSGVFDEHQGIRLTVDGMIVDESRLLLFYSMDNAGREKLPDVKDLRLFDEQGVPMQNHALSWGNDLPDPDQKAKNRGTIDVTFTKDFEIPDTMILRVKMYGYPDDTWELPIKVDKTKFAGLTQVYEIQQTVIFENQKITFTRMTVYPTRVALEIAYDPANTKKILAYDDIRILDEKGDSFGTISNGIIATYPDDHHTILYLESNYFKQPKELHLAASSIKALDKDRLQVPIDLNQGIMLKQPDDRLQLKQVRRFGDTISLQFSIRKGDPKDKDFTYGVFSSSFADASDPSNPKFSSQSTGSSGDESGVNNIDFNIPAADYQNPINLTIDQYPTRIYGDMKIRVK